MKRSFFSILFLLAFLFFPIRAAAAGNEEFFAAMPEDVFSSPADPVTTDDLARLLGSPSTPFTGTLDRGQFCCWLDCWLTDHDLILDKRNTCRYDDLLPGMKNYVNIVSLTEGGIVGGENGLFRHRDKITAGEAVLALRRAALLSRTRSNDQPCDTLPLTEAQSVSALEHGCMLGHSNVVGFSLYVESPLDCAAKNGISAGAYLTDATIVLCNGRTGNVYDALSLDRYRRTYIMLGTNDVHLGDRGTARYAGYISTLIDLVRIKQPDSAVCLLAVTPIGLNRESIYSYHHQDNIRLYNETQKDIARRKGIEYLDIFTPVCNADGYMREGLSRGDGIHFTPAGYEQILDVLLTHPMEDENG